MSSFEYNPAIEAKALPPNCPQGHLYTVVQGDTLSRIARKYNVSLQELINANPQITNPNLIYPGQIVCIPAKTSINCPHGFIYRVMAGDSMYMIARRYGIELSALIKANPQVVNPDVIQVGMELCIPKPVGVQPPVSVMPPQPVHPPVVMPPYPPIDVNPIVAPIQRPCPPPYPTPIPAPPPVPMPMPMPTPPPYPAPMPIHPPCPGPINPGEHPMPYQPMPVYVVVPWDECPYRPKKKKHHHKHHCEH